MDKVSDKLASMVAEKPAQTRVRLNVMVKRGLAPARLKSLSETIAKPPGSQGPEFIPISGMLCVESSLDDVVRIARHADVEWVDVEATAPVEELLD